MKARARYTMAAVLVFLTLVVVGAGGVAVYANRLTKHTPTQETLIYGQSELYPGSQAALRVVAREVGNGSPIAGADVRVALKSAGDLRAQTLYEGTTDDTGSVDVVFTVPEDAAAESTLIVETRSRRRGKDRVERDVAVTRDHKILLSTDKPIYQPGQMIHIRALALGSMDLVPAAEQPLALTVTDAKGNKVFRRDLTTSEYGVTAVDFQLADQVNTGNYKIEATLGETTSETTVQVKPYVLPKFKVDAAPDAPFYLPGERVTGGVDAQYFFGKPVDGGAVTLTGYTFDVQLNEVFQITGDTDAEGRYDFAFDLPDYLIGGGLEAQVSTFILEIAVTDGADHTERTQVRLPVARERLLIEAVPESGELVAGVENIVYIVTSTPDGRPVPAELIIEAEGQRFTVESGEYGLAEWRFTPSSLWQEIQVTARDAQGHTTTRQITFEGREVSPILLRPDRAIAHVGETLHVDAFSTSSTGAIYLDIIREGQTVSTRALEPENRHAQADIDLTPELYGTLELHAYVITQRGEIMRDTRLVVVDAPRDLAIDIDADRETYKPGETAGLDFNITGTDGEGVPSVLGLAAVDESVFALQEMDPGFLKLYFLLEKELMTPKYDIHGFNIPALMSPGDGPTYTAQDQAAQDQAAQASLAGTTMGGGHTLAINTREEKMRQLEERRGALLHAAGLAVLPVTLLLPLGMLAVVGVTLARAQVLGRSLLTGLAAVGLLACAAMPIFLMQILDVRRPHLLGRFFYTGEVISLLAGGGILAGFVAWIALLIRAVVKKETERGVLLGLVLLYLVAVPLMVALGEHAMNMPPDWLAFALVGSFALPPLAMLVWSAGEVWQRRGWVAFGTLALVGLTLGGVAGGVLLTAGGVRGPQPQDAGFAAPVEVVVEEPAWELEDAADEAMPMPAPTEMPRAEEKGTVAPTQTEAPRLRQLFGETMAWMPELPTEEDGTLHVDMPLYDNITTWRLTAVAHSQDGRLGATTTGLRVFQDFFVDFDLPYAMTQGDEVALPVAVYNYLEEAQEVRLVLEEAPWFEMVDDAAEKTLTIGPSDVEVVRFHVRVTATQGRFRPTVWAYGESMSDATTSTHDVLISPNGKPLEETWSGRLEESVSRTVEIPDAVIPGTAHIAVKIYPGIVSQVVEGMDALLRMPHGCFEQTSSSTYPNVLVLDYMKSTEQTTPEIQMKAEQYINLGYQRLTTFEVPGGGFSLFGDAPPDRMLTAYGLMEFTDMARVFPVDAQFVDRAAQWLIAQQAGDGSWENDRGLVHEQTWSALGNDRVPVTAYITWALVHAGYGDAQATKRGLAYVREHATEVEDPYGLALVANTLAAADPRGDFTQQVLDRLAEQAVVDGDAAYWPSEIATMMGSQGKTGSLETTALVAYAFLNAGHQVDLANKALTHLIREKDAHGTWHSTQATILALKALLKSVTDGSEQTDATVTVRVNGGAADPINVTPETYDVVRTLTFEDVGPGENAVQIEVEGEGQLMAQVTAQYYVPWDRVPVQAQGEGLLDIDVTYDRTALAVEDTVGVRVTVTLNEPGTVDWALVDLGVPPGFTVLPEALEARIQRDLALPMDDPSGRVKKFELTGRQVLVYLQNLQHGEPLRFEYQLRARFPVKAQAPASQAYDYYNPDIRAEEQPVVLEVTE